jgi:hypothetical protein
MSSANRDSLTSSLPISISFISYSYLIALARNCKTMLNRYGESCHLCFVHAFRGDGFTFYPLSMMLPVGLSYIDFVMLRYNPFIPSFIRAFITKYY